MNANNIRPRHTQQQGAASFSAGHGICACGLTTAHQQLFRQYCALSDAVRESFRLDGDLCSAMDGSSLQV